MHIKIENTLVISGLMTATAVSMAEEHTVEQMLLALARSAFLKSVVTAEKTTQQGIPGETKFVVEADVYKPGEVQALIDVAVKKTIEAAKSKAYAEGRKTAFEQADRNLHRLIRQS